jgi:diguanylate cyclase (GGDEF)-like protein/PAS domain S-box-containing protein
MAGETILVVEDEAIIAHNLQRILSGFGYQVPETIESGLKAVLAVEILHPDLVLMDIQLPGEMDGIEAAHCIHAHHDLPVVYLTAYAEDTRLVQASQTAPYGYLVKPVQDRELRVAIEMALLRHKLDQKLKESEIAYRQLYHNTPAMLQTIDPAGITTQVSDYWLAMFGYTRKEVIGRSALDFVSESWRGYILEDIYPKYLQIGMVRDTECQFVCKDGRKVDVYFSAVGVKNDQGDLLHTLVALVEITARKRAEAAERDQRTLAEALRDTAAALSSTLSFEEVLERVLTNVGTVVPHDAVNIMLVEKDIARIVRCHGYRELGREEQALASIQKIRELPELYLMAKTHEPVTIPDTQLLPRWEPGWVRSYAGAPIIIKERLVGFINLIGLTPGFYQPEHAARLQVFADQAAIAIENARLYAEVQRLATVDEVTGIFNRRRLFELGHRELERSRRYQLPLAAILLDIDHFKKINDTYGHNTGDRVLAGIASLISRNIRGIDLFGRYGGEEFVVLLPQTDRQCGLEVAERLRSLVADLLFKTNRGTISVTISLGVALITEGIPSLATLIDRADQAMYSAKQAGRNRVEIYES